MRLLLKLTAAVLLAGALQVGFGGTARELFDEARFMIRVHVACMSGIPLNAPHLLDELATYRNASDATDTMDAVATQFDERPASGPAKWDADGTGDAGCDIVCDLDSPPGHI